MLTFVIPKLKTPMKGKRFATIEEIKEKSKRFRSVSRIGKNAGISVLYLKRVTLQGTRQLLINKKILFEKI